MQFLNTFMWFTQNELNLYWAKSYSDSLNKMLDAYDWLIIWYLQELVSMDKLFKPNPISDLRQSQNKEQGNRKVEN